MGSGSSLSYSGNTAMYSSIVLSCFQSPSVASVLIGRRRILTLEPKNWSMSLSVSNVVVRFVWVLGIGISWILLSCHMMSVSLLAAVNAL